MLAKPQPVHCEQISAPTFRGVEEALREGGLYVPLPPNFGGGETINEESATSENAMYFGQRPRQKLDVLKHLVGDNDIEGGSIERHKSVIADSSDAVLVCGHGMRSRPDRLILITSPSIMAARKRSPNKLTSAATEIKDTRMIARITPDQVSNEIVVRRQEPPQGAGISSWLDTAMPFTRA